MRLEYKNHLTGCCCEPKKRGAQGCELFAGNTSVKSCIPKTQGPAVLRSKGGGRWISQLQKRTNKFLLPELFCSMQALNRLDPASSRQQGQVFLTQSIDANATLTGTPRSQVSPAIWASFTIHLDPKRICWNLLLSA